HVALFEELQRRGFVEGQNLLVDAHGYGLRVEQLAEHASALVKAQVDVILCAGDATTRAAQQATKTIPILSMTDDMVGSRLVSSLAKPDGNTTGASPPSLMASGKNSLWKPCLRLAACGDPCGREHHLPAAPREAAGGGAPARG